MRQPIAVAIVCSVLGWGAGIGTAGAVAGSGKVINMAIEPQALSSALQAFSQQTGLQVGFASKVAENLQTRGTQGAKTVEEALRELLQGTQLRYTFANEQTVVISSVNSTVKGDACTTTIGWTGSEKVGDCGEGDSGRTQRLAAQVEAEPAQKSGGESTLEKDFISEQKLEEVVVTAQKRKEALKDVPISISVLRGEDLDRSALRDVTETLRDVPGVTINSNLNNHNIVVRGIAPLAGVSPAAYYFDGVNFNRGAPDLNSFDLQRIEVLRGPQGTLYGANSVSGVVRVFSQDAALDKFEFKTRVLGSSTDGGGKNYQGDLAVNVPIVDGKLAVRGVVDYQNLGGWIDGPLGKDLNSQELRNYRLKVNAQPTEALSIGLSGQWVRNSIGVMDTSTDDRLISATVPEFQSFDFDIYALNVGYEASGFSVSNVTAYYDNANPVTLDLGVFGGGLPHTVASLARVTHAFSDELILTSAPSSAWKWTLGGYYRDARDRDGSAIPLFNSVTDGTNTSQSYAVFGEVGRRFLGDTWGWTLGLRNFHDRATADDNRLNATYHPRASFHSTTPRAVLTWYPSDRAMLYASYAQGFRSGLLQSARALTFPPAGSDKLNNYEFGAKKDFLDQKISLDVAVYYMSWKDVQQLITLLGANNIGINVAVNGKSASGTGMDFAAIVRPLKGLQLGLNFSWNDLAMDEDVITLNGGVPATIYKKGDRLSGSPQWTAAASADYSFPIAGGYGGRFSVAANYNTPQDLHAFAAPGTVFASTGRGDSVLLARGGISLLAPAHWTATLFVTNAFNDYGTIVANGGAEELRSRSQPRTIGLQFDYRY